VSSGAYASGSPTLQNGLIAGTLSETAVRVPCLLNKPDSSRFNGSDLLRSLDCSPSIRHAADQILGRLRTPSLVNSAYSN
jgi:hypothetical protein